MTLPARAPRAAPAQRVGTAEVRALARELGGAAIHREDSAYAAAAASAFPNPEVLWEPDVVVVPSGVADVITAVRWAAGRRLQVAVRAGGVGWKGARGGTVLLDLRALRGIWLDPARRSVRVQGGAIWRDVHRELAPFGLAAAGPQFPRLGVAGHVLGGGHGWLSNKLGWASDTLLSADVVTADGRLVHADHDHEPELFWALRGAGHEVGVVVGLELALLPLEQVSTGAVWFGPERVAELLAHYGTWAPDGPDELSTLVSIAHPPPGLPVAPHLRGRPLPHVLLCHCGTPEQAAADLAALRGLGGVVADTVRQLPWPELAMGKDAFAGGMHRRTRMHYVRGLSAELAALAAERSRDLPPLCFAGVHRYGGALARVDEDATAMSHRDQPWNFMVQASWTPVEDATSRRVWMDAFLAGLAPHAANAFYVNYLFDEPEHVPAAYNARAWARLQTVKREWDPAGVIAGHVSDRIAR